MIEGKSVYLRLLNALAVRFTNIMNPLAPLPSDLPTGSISSSQALVQSALDASLNGMVAYEAVRESDTDAITDLRLVLINRVAAADAQLTVSAMVGKNLKKDLPSLAASPLYNRVVQVLTTGLPERFTFVLKTPLFEEGRHFDTQINRIADLAVVSYNDITARFQAEQTSQQRTDSLHFVTDNSLTAIALYSIVRDPDSNAAVDLRYELINRMAERMVGRTADQLVGKTIREAFPGIEQTPIWLAYMRLAETGEVLRFHNHYTQHNFDLWYEVQGVRENDQIVLSFLDITELKQAQERIERQNHEFRQVLDNALTAISHFTCVREEQPDGRPGKIIDFVYQSFNHAAEQFTGKRAQDVIGNRLLTVFPEHRTNGFFNRWVNLVETQGSARFQHKRSNANVWFDLQAVAQEDGFILSYIDITAIKQAELEQQRQTELTSSLLAAAPVMFTHFAQVCDEQGQLIDFEVLQANQTAADSLNYPLSELIGKRLTSITPTIKNGPIFAEYAKVVATGVPTQFERQHGDKWFHISVVKLGDGFITCSVDVTESRLYRQQLEALNQELTRSNDSLQQFAYVASHDLQEPLRKIQAFGDLLDEHYGPQLGEFGHDAISRMQSAATRMSMLITDLLTYSRISTNRQPFQPVDLDELLTNVLSDLEVRIGETNATIKRTQLPTVAGDPTQLRQLFQNLISNSLKFQPTSNDGVQHHPHVDVDCHQQLINGRMWYDISIHDNGIGFEEKYVDRIFQVFQRLHNKQSYAGTGVGLAICKRVIDSHGGTLTAKSEPGKGATFQIHLPG
nr:hypothetical protein A6C57_13160 [Fibrella sp. ES10-3-2-2]